MECSFEVSTAKAHEFGHAQITSQDNNALLQGIKDHVDKQGNALLDVWMSHGDQVTRIPDDFIVIASTNSCPIAGIANEAKKIYGLQFHPEVTHTLQGQRIYEHFVLTICQCKPLWTPAHIIEDAIAQVRRQVGSDHVLLGLSGGVDSILLAYCLNLIFWHWSVTL